MIFNDKLTELEYTDKVKEMKKKLAGIPAAQIKTEQIGKKKLAYKARGCEYGWYVYFIYKCTEDLVNTKLDLLLRQDDDVIKFLSTNYQADYVPDEDVCEQPVKQPVDIFNLIFGLN